MNEELSKALDDLEEEKKISKVTLLDAIEQSLLQACQKHFGRSEMPYLIVHVDRETCEFEIYLEKEVTENVEDELSQISLSDARMMDPSYELGDKVRVDVNSKAFGRIATQNAKNVILQKIREEERKSLFKQYYDKKNEVVTGIVGRYIGKNVTVNLGRVDAMLNENEMIKTRTRDEQGHEIISTESFYPKQRIKVYVLDVHDTSKGPRILVSRTHPDLVKRLFENEVKELKTGEVEIRSIAREAGSRTKIAVYSADPNVDPVGACVGVKGQRVDAVVEELGGEKIDIINWDENPALLIENALSPAKVIMVGVDPDDKSATVVVPDYQLSLAIGKEGQNARLAARLTGYKIDIKSETQAKESGDLLEYESDYYDEEYDEYDENYDGYEDGEYEDGEYEDGEYEDDGQYYEDDGSYSEDEDNTPQES